MQKFWAIPAVAAGLLASVLSGHANAVTCAGAPLDNPSTVAFAILEVPGTCVQAGDKLFGDFTFGNLPTGPSSQVGFTVNGFAHNIGFDADYIPGTSYSGLGYQVAVNSGTNTMDLLTGDFVESFGNESTLTKTAAGFPSQTCQNGGTSPPQPCPLNINLDTAGGGVTALTVTEALDDGSTAQISAILDTILETPRAGVPEPASLALLGTALLGLGLAPRGARRTD